LVAAALTALVASGCGVSVSVSVHTISNNDAYLAAWSRGWTVVNRASVAYLATSHSPGACNIGSTKVLCYDTDSRVVSGLRPLAAALASVQVPAQYRAANDLTIRGIDGLIHGLGLRMESLGPGHPTLAQRDTWFTQSKAAIADANKLLSDGYQAFPNWARPTPVPR
jgi:hypothetical protein